MDVSKKSDNQVIPCAEVTFFERDDQALQTYLVLRQGILAICPDAEVLVQKSQISFRGPRPFVWVWLPSSRGGKKQPPGSLYFTFGAPCPLLSQRITAATQPYPGRFTHHVLVSGPHEVDQELLDFAALSLSFRNQKKEKKA